MLPPALSHWEYHEIIWFPLRCFYSHLRVLPGNRRRISAVAANPFTLWFLLSVMKWHLCWVQGSPPIWASRQTWVSGFHFISGTQRKKKKRGERVQGGYCLSSMQSCKSTPWLERLVLRKTRMRFHIRNPDERCPSASNQGRDISPTRQEEGEVFSQAWCYQDNSSGAWWIWNQQFLLAWRFWKCRRFSLGVQSTWCNLSTPRWNRWLVQRYAEVIESRRDQSAEKPSQGCWYVKHLKYLFEIIEHY